MVFKAFLTVTAPPMVGSP